MSQDVVENATHPEEISSDGQSYYQRSILTILNSVQAVYGNILSEEETKLLQTIVKELPMDAQRLLFRIYLRKVGWIRRNKLEYQDIGDRDLSINVLIEKNILEWTINQVEEVVNVLQFEELRALAKELNLKSVGKTKEMLVEEILATKKSKQMRLCFFTSPRKSIADEAAESILEKGRLILGPVVRLSSLVRALLDRFVGLYFLEVIPSGEKNLTPNIGMPTNTILGTAILTDLNRLKYPSYSIIRSRPVFLIRQHWLDYEEAVNYERNVQELLNGNDNNDELPLNALQDLLETVKERWQIHFNRIELYDGKQPSSSMYFLRRYSPGWVYTKLMASFIPILERAKAYKEANQLVETLLNQDCYCRGQRGKWWERLVLNLDRHLGEREAAQQAARTALQDHHVRTASRLALERRMSKWAGPMVEDITAHGVYDEIPPTVTIYADPEDKRKTGRKLLYLLPHQMLGSVEELALAYFNSEGWLGVHTESRIYRMLFMLLFWDIIFGGDIPDVFQTPHQTAPLDLWTDAFYEARQELIETRFKLINQDKSQFVRIITDTYSAQYGCQAVGVQWEEYPVTLLHEICCTLGPTVLTPILRSLAEDYTSNCSGLPDLLLYRPDQSDYLLVEVKSANDRFSDIQKNWNVIFRRNGIKHVLCRVLDTDARDQSTKKRGKRVKNA